MKQHLKAELWDKTQYFLSNFYDRMMHYAMFYEGDLNLETMRDAVKYIVDRVPTLHSQYITSFIKPYWNVREDYTKEELVSEETVEDLDKAVREFLLGEIHHLDKLQIRAKIFKCGSKCAYACIINHQCFDGSDFKYVQYKIVEAYNALIKTGSCENVEVKQGRRDFKQLYERMEPNAAKRAKTLYNNASKMGLKKPFKFTDDAGVSKRFITKMIDAETFNKMKAKGKAVGATINDVLLTAFFRAYVKEAGLEKTDTVGITSMMDLRRHFADKKSSEGCTNMTAFMPCKLDGIGESFKDTLDKVLANNNKQKEDDCVGLYGIPLLALGYKLFVLDGLANFVIKLGYENPLVQMSNLGIVKHEDVDFEGCKVYDAYITGAVKYKPYMQLTCLSLDGQMKLCIAERCSDKDEKLVLDFLDDIIKEIKQFGEE